MDWWVRWSTASKESKSLVPDLLRQAPYLVFRAGRAGDEARVVWLRFLVEGAESWSGGRARSGWACRGEVVVSQSRSA